MLYVVATPIGNLGDITLRALEALRSADVIAAEDTRHSGILLKHFGIKKPFVSYHEHNEAMRAAQLVDRLAAGENVALITDAGTPGLSDPGARLIRECIKRELPLTIIPGPSSILTALVGSGFSVEQFFFGGFLPVKSGQRQRELRATAAREETSVYFESPYRLTKTLAVCIDILPGRQLCVARELTKKFEEFRRGSAGELLAHYQARPPKGEIVLLIEGGLRPPSICGILRGFFSPKHLWLTQLSRPVVDSIVWRRATRLMSICSISMQGSRPPSATY
jgi:16S rRNA (cytidine1402-2'-O)-methyltransferase